MTRPRLRIGAAVVVLTLAGVIVIVVVARLSPAPAVWSTYEGEVSEAVLIEIAAAAIDVLGRPPR